MKRILQQVQDAKQPEPLAKTASDIPRVKLIPIAVSPPRPLETREPIPLVTVAPAAAPTYAPFEILASDETLFLALRRWTTGQGVQLIWDAGKDFPARNTVYPAKDLYDAIEMVMADTERSNYPLHACTYANRVIRILHIAQTCQRQ